MNRVSNAIKRECETLARQYSKQDRLVFAILLGLIILLLILSPFLPDSGPRIIKEKLGQQGFDIESFTFEKTNDKFKRIYKASNPLDIGDGTYVEYWEILDISFSPMGIPRYAVKPFPEIVVPATIPISFEISEQEYEKLNKITNGESMEEFTKRLLMQYIQEKEDEASTQLQ